nr:NAD-dependent epimerase/dehydratase family protein [Acidithiobacillus sp.]
NGTILVIGGAGFIGSHTVDLLLAKGHPVRVLDDFSTGKRENLPADHPRLEIVVGNHLDQGLLLRAFHGAAAVLHLAAQVSVQRSLEDPLKSGEQNIMGFLGVVEQARRHSVRIVYASSAAVYGEPAHLPIGEEGPIHPISPYGLEKYVDEQYAQLFGKLFGLSHMGLRYFNVYGPRQDPASPYSGVISRFIAQIHSGHAVTIRGDGLQERDFIHVSDVARANVAALESSANTVVNIASGTRTSILELAELLIQKNQGNGQIQWVPRLQGDIRHSQADIARMRQLLIQPTMSLDAGLETLL